MVDCGFSGKHITKRLEQVGIAPQQISAALISHEHTDHITGLGAVTPHAPVFMTRGTSRAMGARKGACWKVVPIKAGRAFEVGSLSITPFSISHDAREPTGFVLQTEEGLRLGFATDLGQASPSVLDALSGCDLLALEANHDPDMLQGGPYPWWLKRRIASDRGHLSNDSAAQLLDRVAQPALRFVFAMHRSKANNTAELVEESLRSALARTESDARVTVVEQDRVSSARL
jgi:phosphoribosyl 1,2-cyclic phosphodiesterase